MQCWKFKLCWTEWQLQRPNVQRKSKEKNVCGAQIKNQVVYLFTERRKEKCKQTTWKSISTINETKIKCLIKLLFVNWIQFEGAFTREEKCYIYKTHTQTPSQPQSNENKKNAPTILLLNWIVCFSAMLHKNTPFKMRWVEMHQNRVAPKRYWHDYCARILVTWNKACSNGSLPDHLLVSFVYITEYVGLWLFYFYFSSFQSKAITMFRLPPSISFCVHFFLFILSVFFFFSFARRASEL